MSFFNLATLLCMPLAMWAATPLSVEDAFGALQVTSFLLSPDDKWVVYVVKNPRRIADFHAEAGVTTTGVTFDGCGADIWIARVNGQSVQCLTKSRGNSWSPAWSPDGSRLAFFSDRDGQARAWLWERTSNRLHLASKQPVRPVFMQSPLWTPDGKSLIVKRLPQGMSMAAMRHLAERGGKEAPAANRQEKPAAAVTVYGLDLFRKKGDIGRDEDGREAQANQYLGDLCVVNAQTGKTRVLAGRVRPRLFRLSPDGRYLAYDDIVGTQERESDGLLQVATKLTVVRIGNGASRPISAPSNVLFRWQDGRTLTYSEDEKTWFRLDMETGAVRQSSEAPAIPTARHNLEQKLVTKEGNLFYQATKASQPVPITHFHSPLAFYPPPAFREVTWQMPNGKTLGGRLYLPTGYEAGKRYPLLVTMYGGSPWFTAYGSLHANETQIYLTRGYAVFFAGTNYSAENPMKEVAEQVLAGVDKVIAAGVADPDRLGIFGGSYGAYNAYALAVQTQRFKAVVARYGSANLIDDYLSMLPDGSSKGINWAEKGQGRMGGTLWEKRSRYIENSPLFFFDRLTSPVLITCGADNSADLQAAQSAYIALRRLGKVSQFAAYAGEGHGYLGFANRVDETRRVIAWFDKFVYNFQASNSTTK